MPVLRSRRVKPMLAAKRLRKQRQRRPRVKPMLAAEAEAAPAQRPSTPSQRCLRFDPRASPPGRKAQCASKVKAGS